MATLIATLKQSGSQPKTAGPARWDVSVDGKRVVSASTDPERAACRALKARGVAGKVHFQHESGAPGLALDIDDGAAFPPLTKKGRKGCRPAGLVAEPKPKTAASKSEAGNMPKPSALVYGGAL